MGSDNRSKKVKLSKLTQLEDEVASLSEELKASKNTITQLKQTLAERDQKILQLESKLNYAQQSLLKKTALTIHQCRDQIKSGIDEKIVNPALTQIQQQIDVIHGIVHEAKDFISKKKLLIQENINVTSHIVQQCPDQAIRYFEKLVVEPGRILVHNTVELIDTNAKNSRDLINQKIIFPGKVWYDKALVSTHALPTQGQYFFQVWVMEPVMQKVNTLPTLKVKLIGTGETLIDNLKNQLQSGIKQSLENTAEAIKKSQFWDGKRKIEAV